MEHGSEKMKSPEKIQEEDVDTQKEIKEVSKESRAKRKKSLPRKSTRSTVKRQKMEEETERSQGILRHSSKRRVCRRCPKVLSEMLEDFDRQDVMDLYRLVKERYIYVILWYSYSADAKWDCYSYADREEIPSKSRDDIKDVEKEIGG
ncbi:hypothetical protein Tco_1401418 [Tanacetum coccineum]